MNSICYIKIKIFLTFLFEVQLCKTGASFNMFWLFNFTCIMIFKVYFASSVLLKNTLSCPFNICILNVQKIIICFLRSHKLFISKMCILIRNIKKNRELIYIQEDCESVTKSLYQGLFFVQSS